MHDLELEDELKQAIIEIMPPSWIFYAGNYFVTVSRYEVYCHIECLGWIPEGLSDYMQKETVVNMFRSLFPENAQFLPEISKPYFSEGDRLMQTITLRVVCDEEKLREMPWAKKSRIPSYWAKESTIPLYLVVGKSCSGKDTFVQQAMKYYGLTSVLSYTTREPRIEGEDTHHFVDPQWFEDHKDELAAHFLYDGHQYGALKEDVAKANLYIVDWDSALKLKELLFNRVCKIVYLSASISERARRMYRRTGETNERHIVDRLLADDESFPREYTWKKKPPEVDYWLDDICYSTLSEAMQKYPNSFNAALNWCEKDNFKPYLRYS